MSKRRRAATRNQSKQFEAERRRELAKRAAEFGVRVPEQQTQEKKESDGKAR